MSRNVVRCDICGAMIKNYENVYQIRYQPASYADSLSLRRKWEKADVCEYCIEQIKEMVIASRKIVEERAI